MDGPGGSRKGTGRQKTSLRRITTRTGIHNLRGGNEIETANRKDTARKKKPRNECDKDNKEEEQHQKDTSNCLRRQTQQQQQQQTEGKQASERINIDKKTHRNKPNQA